MHDCKGRLIEKHDAVKFKNNNGQMDVGRVCDQWEGSETCNLGVYSLCPYKGPEYNSAVTASECEIIVKHDGTEPFEPDAGESQADPAE